MTIRLKTDNLRIGKRKMATWSNLEQEVIIVPLNIEMLSDRLIAKMNYVLAKDFRGIKKNSPLTFYMVGGFKLEPFRRTIKEIHIPIKDNQ